MPHVFAEEIDCIKYIPNAVVAHYAAKEKRKALGLGLPNRYTLHLTKVERDRTLGTAAYTLYGGKKEITLYISDTSLPELTNTIGHELDHAHFYDSTIWKLIHSAGIFAKSFAEEGKKPTFPLSEIVKHAQLIALVRPLLEARAYFTTGVIKGESLDSIAGNTKQMIMDEYVNRIYVDRMKEETAIQLVLDGELPSIDPQADIVQRRVDETIRPLYESGVDMAITAVRAGFEDVKRFERAQEADNVQAYYDICMGQ